MATYHPTLRITRAAAADLSAKQWYAVKIDSNGKAALCDTAGEYVTGILENDPVAGQAAAICVDGILKGIAGGDITIGAEITVDVNGKLVAATTANQVLGRALEAAASGDIFQFIVTREGAM